MAFRFGTVLHKPFGLSIPSDPGSVVEHIGRLQAWARTIFRDWDSVATLGIILIVTGAAKLPKSFQRAICIVVQ
jgi:hypothetical protein